jgi:hypothetical protein
MITWFVMSYSLVSVFISVVLVLVVVVFSERRGAKKVVAYRLRGALGAAGILLWLLLVLSLAYFRGRWIS